MHRLQEKSGGKVPVINRDDFWLPDSDEIVKYLEKQVPEPSMASSVPAEVTSSIFGAFRGFLMAKVRGRASWHRRRWGLYAIGLGFCQAVAHTLL